MSDALQATSSTRGSRRCSTFTASCPRDVVARRARRWTCRSPARRASSARCWAGASSCATCTARPTASASFRDGRRPAPSGDGDRSAGGVAAGGACGRRWRGVPPAVADVPRPAGGPSGLACLDRVVARRLGGRLQPPHHAPDGALQPRRRCSTSSPRELTDWFWVAYADAYDWVVEPNVLGMGTFAAGDLMTHQALRLGRRLHRPHERLLRPCAFDPKQDCPITSLYWAFLARKQKTPGREPASRHAPAQPGQAQRDAEG